MHLQSQDGFVQTSGGYGFSVAELSSDKAARKATYAALPSRDRQELLRFFREQNNTRQVLSGRHVR